MKTESKTQQLEEELLVQRLRDRATCRAAFADVIAYYSEQLYRQIRRMVPSHDDAADLLQNTFMKAWMNIENFKGTAKLSTWLHKIAINESLSFLEKERRRQNLSLDDDENGLVNAIMADEWVDGDELTRKLRVAISMLPEKQRLVFNMRYYEEMKYEQMSEILGTSVGALKASYHHAEKKIKEFFADND